MSSDYKPEKMKKHDNLKEMLDSTKDSLKLEAMKHIIEMIAKGKDAGSLFPSVVKNVVSKNIEIKKLVYMYIIRYAENQQDLVLLSVSTFQRALKEPNQLIRANALKVLSSIRVKMVVPIVLLAIKDAVVDLSAYVRKTASFAISKLYELDPGQKIELIPCVERLLNDHTTLVVGPAVVVYEKICPERTDLIHKIYKKLCNFIVDVGEWSQVVIINLLTRYIRTYFNDPNSSDPEPDHRLLLKSVKPLLQSQNSSVVIAVVQLYYHTAPKGEFTLVVKPLIRLLRSCSEIQIIILDVITSIILKDKGWFEPYLKSFFVRRSDVIRVKVLKLDILTYLSNEKNIFVILKEMRAYLGSIDNDFVVSTISSIGKCAVKIPSVIDQCLTGLLSLLGSKNECVVSRSVIVIKDLIRFKPTEPYDIIRRLSKIFESVINPEARGTILWLLGEYHQGVSKISPDILRKIAKNFNDESIQVKQQALNLAMRLHLREGEKTKLLCEYIFNIARYDKNYDIRDKVRFLRYFYQNKTGGFLQKEQERIFLGAKLGGYPTLGVIDKSNLQLGTLSHYLNISVDGYQTLPSFTDSRKPKENDENPPVIIRIGDTEYEETTSYSSDYISLEEEESGKNDLESSDDETFSNESDETQTNLQYFKSSNLLTNDTKYVKLPSSTHLIDSSNDSRSPSSSLLIDSSVIDDFPYLKSTTRLIDSSTESQYLKPSSTTLDSSKFFKSSSSSLLITTPVRKYMDHPNPLDLDNDIPDTIPILTPSKSGFTPPITITPSTQTLILLDKILGKGLTITYKYPRYPHLYSKKMLNISLTFTNHNNEEITGIKLTSNHHNISEFTPIEKLSPGCTLLGILGIDFNDTIQPADLIITSSLGDTPVRITPPIGELIRPISITEEKFLEEQLRLRGMNEHTVVITSKINLNVTENVLKIINANRILNGFDDVYWFAGETLSSSSLVLISIHTMNDKYKISVNSEKIVVGSLLINELKTVFE